MFGAEADPRTRTLTVAGGATLLLLAGMAMNRPDSDPAPPTESELSAECVRQQKIQGPPLLGTATERFQLRQGDDILRVSVSDPDEWISLCHTTTEGVLASFGAKVPAEFRVVTAGNANDVLVGRLPAGARSVEARLPSGETLTGSTGGGVFAIWSPGKPVSGAEVTATGPNGTVTSPAP